MIKPKHTFTAILGGGLAGLITAAFLEKAGQEYLLIEGQNEFGGLVKGQQEHGIWLDFGLKSVPAGENISENPLLVIKKKLGLSFQIESWKETPQTFDKKVFSEFMGFGETKSRVLVEELGYYTKSPRLLVSGGWRHLTSELLSLIPESKRLPRSIVTRFSVQDGKIISALINGELVIEAEKFILAMPPEVLKSLVPQGGLAPKTLQRISKTEPLTAVSLDIATEKKLTPAKNIFVFKDTAEEDFYVLGHFVSNADPLRQVSNLQLSTWMTLLDSESSLDDEVVSKAIRTMKKVIKKSFPELIDNNSWERLLAVPQALGQYDHLSLEKDFTLAGLSNLYLAGAQVKGSERNLMGAMQSALSLSDKLLVSQVVQATTQFQQESESSL